MRENIVPRVGTLYFLKCPIYNKNMERKSMIHIQEKNNRTVH